MSYNSRLWSPKLTAESSLIESRLNQGNAGFQEFFLFLAFLPVL
jgi:hypothetical protein